MVHEQMLKFECILLFFTATSNIIFNNTKESNVFRLTNSMKKKVVDRHSDLLQDDKTTEKLVEQDFVNPGILQLIENPTGKAMREQLLLDEDLEPENQHLETLSSGMFPLFNSFFRCLFDKIVSCCELQRTLPRKVKKRRSGDLRSNEVNEQHQLHRKSFVI